MDWGDGGVGVVRLTRVVVASGFPSSSLPRRYSCTRDSRVPKFCQKSQHVSQLSQHRSYAPPPSPSPDLATRAQTASGLRSHAQRFESGERVGIRLEVRAVTNVPQRSSKDILTLTFSRREAPIHPSLDLDPDPSTPLLNRSSAIMAHELGETVKDLAQYAPGVSIAAASSSAFVITARVARSAAYAAGVSCATPMLGTLWGIASVGGASALAGQAARTVLEWPNGSMPKGIQGWGGMTLGGLRRPLETLHGGSIQFGNETTKELVKDAIFGSLAYAVLGRGIQSALPSDISYPGALAKRSMKSNGAHYATDNQRKTLATWLRKDGCHHCGSKLGKVVGDHMPPNKMAFGSAAAAQAAREGTWRTKLWNFLRMVPRQKFYPQCRPCSDKQSTAVRMGSKILVQHNGALRLGVLVATLVSARHYVMKHHPEEYREFEKKLEKFPLLIT